MAQDILLKRSAVAGKVPLTSDVPLGSLALNTYDGKLFTKKSVSGVESIVEIGSGAGVADGDKGDITVSSSGATWTIDAGVVTSAKIADNTIVDGDINASAAIADTKLATISTAGKVSNSATTATSVNTASAIVARDASGNFSAGTITAASIGVGQTSPATTLDLSGAYSTNIVAVAALNINCSSGNYFTKTINGNSAFTVSNVPTSRSYAFTLEITHTSGDITWFSGVVWPAGTAPTLTTGKTHLFVFVTDDGGTRWRAASLVDYTN